MQQILSNIVATETTGCLPRNGRRQVEATLKRGEVGFSWKGGGFGGVWPVAAHVIAE